MDVFFAPTGSLFQEASYTAVSAQAAEQVRRGVHNFLLVYNQDYVEALHLPRHESVRALFRLKAMMTDSENCVGSSNRIGTAIAVP